MCAILKRVQPKKTNACRSLHFAGRKRTHALGTSVVPMCLYTANYVPCTTPGCC